MDWLLGAAPDEPPHYYLVLVDPDGKQVSKRMIRVWIDHPEAVEMQFAMKGRELGRDANHHAKEAA